MDRVEIGAAIGASFRFVGEAWSKAWGIMLIVVGFTALLQLVETLQPSWVIISFVGLIVSVFLTSAAMGALYRLRLSDDHPGNDDFRFHPAGLQWGGLEWRALGARLLIGLCIGVLLVVAFIIWAIILGLSLSNSPGDVQAIQSGTQVEKMAAFRNIMLGPAGILTLVILGPIVICLGYLGARLALFALLAAETRSFDFGKAWTMTKGAVLALILGSALIFTVELIIGALSGGVAGFVAAVTGHHGRGAAWGGIAGQTVSAAINAPLFAGLALYVYRTRRADPGVAATFS